MKIEGGEIRRCKQISSNKPCYLNPSLNVNPEHSVQAFQALQVSCFAGSAFYETGRRHLCPQGKKCSAGDKAHRTHSLCMLEIHSSSVQKSNMPHLYTNSGDMIVTAHMVTSLAWEIIQKSTNKHFKEEGRKGLLCCLPRVSFFKVKWPDLFETDVIRSKKNADLVNSLPLCIISDLFPFIIV